MGEVRTDATDAKETEQKLERAPKPTVRGMAPLQRPPASNATETSAEKDDE
jgi:hypothetical protein